MPAAMEKAKDIRMMKTEKALNSAMLSLLRKYNFKKIAVKDICEESLISRATFYTRYSDKYNFLKWWIIDLWPEDIINQDEIYEEKAKKINQFIEENKPIIKNLFLEADNWTLDTLFDALCSTLHLMHKKTTNGEINPEYIVLSNFYVGGMMQYIVWHVKNGFPRDVSPMNVYLYEMIDTFHKYNRSGMKGWYHYE